MTLTNLSDENYDGTSTQPSATGTNSIAIGVGATAPGANTTVFSSFVGIGTQYTVPQGPSYALDIKGDSGTTSGSNIIKLSYGDNVNNWLLISDGSTGSTVQARNKGLTLATRHNDNISFTRNNISVGSFTSSGLNVVGSVTAGADSDLNGITVGNQTIYRGSGALKLIGGGVQNSRNLLNLSNGAGATIYGGSAATNATLRSTYGVTVDGGDGDVTLASDVTFTGDTYNVLWDKSTDDFVFDQGARLDFGGGASIYRDASGIFRITGPSASDTYFSFSNNLIFYRSGSAAAQMMISGTTQRFHAYGNITVGGTVDGVDIAQNIPATLGTAGQVLTVNSGGTAGEWADAAGGADLYAANESSPTAQPSATGANAIAIGDSAVSSGIRSVAFGKGNAAGSDSFAAAIGNASTSLGARAANSVAIGPSADCNRSNSIALGYLATVAGGAGTGTVAISQSYASGTDSFAAVIANNTSSYGATGANSVAIGQQAKASQTNAIAINGTASGIRSIAIGNASSATSTSATAVGYLTTAVGSALAIGTDANAQHGYSAAILRGKTEQQGKMAFSGIFFGTKGDAQGSTFVLVADTTDATATPLTGNNLSASTNNQIVAATDTCITFSGTVVAMQNGAQSYGSWEVRGLLVNDGGTTTLPVFNISEIGSSGWKLNLYADNTNNALTVQVTGVAATNIRWVANIATAEVTYA